MNILIGGEAGQGLATIGQLLSKSLLRSGYFILVTQGYQSRIRGGHNTFSICVGTDEIYAPAEAVDVLIALDSDTVTLHRKDLSEEGLIIIDAALDISGDRVLRVPFKEFGKDRFSNVAALCVVSSLIGIDKDMTAKTLRDFFSRKPPQVMEENLKVLEAAADWCSGLSATVHKLPPVNKPLQRLMLNGNEAIALGSLSAGLKFFAFYPMTPSTSIAMNLTAHATQMGLIVEQAEDEIAAINMAIGASFAGAPSMTATSGGGFALMAEGVSLAAMTETPLVIVVAQRPGPATGLPTRTEQADLEFVLHAGHGEFPKAIFAPGTVEECFQLTRRAFELSERYQCPIFILTDQFLADSYRAVLPLDIENLAPVHLRDKHIGTSEYRRFELTETGVSPRLFPGITEHLVVADSDEHTQDGHITEDLSVRRLMVEKRLKKGEGICVEVIPPEFKGPKNPDLLMICWGSSKGAVCQAASRMGSNGEKVSTLHFSQVWPLVPEQFMVHMQDAGRVVSIEGNATGQLARLIRRETGFEIREQVLRYDGLPFTPESILRELSR